MFQPRAHPSARQSSNTLSWVNRLFLQCVSCPSLFLTLQCPDSNHRRQLSQSSPYRIQCFQGLRAPTRLLEPKGSQGERNHNLRHHCCTNGHCYNNAVTTAHHCRRQTATRPVQCPRRKVTWWRLWLHDRVRNRSRSKATHDALAPAVLTKRLSICRVPFLQLPASIVTTPIQCMARLEL